MRDDWDESDDGKELKKSPKRLQHTKVAGVRSVLLLQEETQQMWMTNKKGLTLKIKSI
jgi:hypothetical protein